MRTSFTKWLLLILIVITHAIQAQQQTIKGTIIEKSEGHYHFKNRIPHS